MGIYHFVLIGAGIYCIIRGIMTIATGKVSAREEAKIKNYSDKGVKGYKLLSAISNIIGGIVCIALGIVKMMNLIETTTMAIITLVVIALLGAIYYIIEKKCKEAK